MNRELILLKIRNLIADKEMIRAMADRDLLLGGWTMDYSTWRLQVDDDLQKLFSQLKKGGE